MCFHLPPPWRTIESTEAGVSQICQISTMQQDSMEHDTEAQTSTLEQMLQAAHVSMSTAAIAGTDELQIDTVLKI